MLLGKTGLGEGIARQSAERVMSVDELDEIVFVVGARSWRRRQVRLVVRWHRCWAVVLGAGRDVVAAAVVAVAADGTAECMCPW